MLEVECINTELARKNVISTLKEPDQLLSSIKGRYNALKKISAKVIRVTFLEEADRILVVTVSPRKHF